MAIRCISIIVLSFYAALTVRAQEPAVFPPSKPYRDQLEARGPVRELSLHEAIAIALAQNPEIAVEAYNRDVSQSNTVNAQSYYDPVGVLNASIVSSNLPVTNILQTGGFDSQITRSWTIAPSIQQNLPGGGNAVLSTNLSRTSTNSEYSLIDPVYGATIGLTITQPLWRGFRRTGVERQIVVNRLNERMNDSQFRQKVAATVEQVINAYWRLLVTIENYESQRQKRDVSVAEYEQARKQPDAASLHSQLSDVASHDQGLTQAATQVVQASNALKRQLAGSVMDPLWAEGLMPSDRPDDKPPSVSLEEAVKIALERRPELEQLRLQLKQSDADIRFDKQETRPSVNLRVEMASIGNAGPLHAIPADVAAVVDTFGAVVGGVRSSYKQALTVQHPNIAAGVEIRFPFRNRAATSQLTAGVLAARKLKTQFHATEEDILVDVRNAWETIAAQRKGLEAARLASQVADDRVVSETAKPKSAPQDLEILRAQRDLAEIRVRELQALIDYQLSTVSFEKAMSTLVDDQQIVVARRSNER